MRLRRGLGHIGDAIYAIVFGALVALGVVLAGAELVLASTERGSARESWEVIAIAVGVCIGIAAGWAVRKHRRQATK